MRGPLWLFLVSKYFSNFYCMLYTKKDRPASSKRVVNMTESYNASAIRNLPPKFPASISTISRLGPWQPCLDFCSSFSSYFFVSLLLYLPPFPTSQIWPCCFAVWKTPTGTLWSSKIAYPLLVLQGLSGSGSCSLCLFYLYLLLFLLYYQPLKTKKIYTYFWWTLTVLMCYMEYLSASFPLINSFLSRTISCCFIREDFPSTPVTSSFHSSLEGPPQDWKLL